LHKDDQEAGPVDAQLRDGLVRRLQHLALEDELQRGGGALGALRRLDLGLEVGDAGGGLRLDLEGLAADRAEGELHG
jgi:hypothetical protein